MFAVRKSRSFRLGVVENDFTNNRTVEGIVVITVEKVDLGDFVRLAILSCVEVTYNWPVAIMEFDFSTCAVGVSRTRPMAERGIVNVGVLIC